MGTKKTIDFLKLHPMSFKHKLTYFKTSPYVLQTKTNFKRKFPKTTLQTDPLCV